MDNRTKQYWIKAISEATEMGLDFGSNTIRIQLPKAKPMLETAYETLIELKGEKFQWTPELDEVAEWMTDNKGRGLLLYGNCGRGKTFLATKVLPLIFSKILKPPLIVRVMSMNEAARKPDEAITIPLLALDDVGTEQRYVNFGTVRYTFDEIVDSAEKDGHLLIITSNLTKDEFLGKYGERVVDRLNKIVKPILYKGKSFR